MSQQRKHDESAVIAISETPQTRQSLAADLRVLGVQAGMTLLVHSSLSKVGYVPGGAISLILALQDVLTPDGTLVMPAFSSHLSDPAQWKNPPVPEAWWQIIRDHTPAFDPAITPTRGIGILPELFRTFPNVRRSYHPMDSFSAWGKHAEYITADHSLAHGLGDGSPLAKLYALDGYTLMIGTTYETNTIFHLGEYRAPNPPLTQQGSPILRDGQRSGQPMKMWRLIRIALRQSVRLLRHKAVWCALARSVWQKRACFRGAPPQISQRQPLRAYALRKLKIKRD